MAFKITSSDDEESNEYLDGLLKGLAPYFFEILSILFESLDTTTSLMSKLFIAEDIYQTKIGFSFISKIFLSGRRLLPALAGISPNILFLLYNFI